MQIVDLIYVEKLVDTRKHIEELARHRLSQNKETKEYIVMRAQNY